MPRQTPIRNDEPIGWQNSYEPIQMQYDPIPMPSMPQGLSPEEEARWLQGHPANPTLERGIDFYYPNSAARLMGFRGCLESGIRFQYTTERTLFWQQVIERVEQIARRDNSMGLIVPLIAMREESLNTRRNQQFCQEAASILFDTFNWATTIDGVDFWEYVYDRICQIGHIPSQRSTSPFHFTVPSLSRRRDSHEQSIPVNERQKKLGAKPAWYAMGAA